jgi:hypothetical protein
MMFKKELLPIRDFKLAAIHVTVSIVLLALIRHPVDDWVVATAILYVCLWIAREVIVNLVLYILKLLIRQGQRVSQNFGVESPDTLPTEFELLAKFLAVVVVALVVFAIIGATLAGGVLAIGGFGFTPLPAYFLWIALGLIIAGGVGLSLMFGLSALVVFAMDSLSESVNPKFNQFQAITRQVDTRLRNKALTRQSPATS